MTEEWFEFDCPVTGIDLDCYNPMPKPGDEIHCPHCGQMHIASLEIGNAHRQNEDGESVCINEEWSRRIS